MVSISATARLFVAMGLRMTIRSGEGLGVFQLVMICYYGNRRALHHLANVNPLSDDDLLVRT